MSDVVITLPDGSKKKMVKNTTIKDVAYLIGDGLGRAAIAGKIDGVPVDLATPVKKNAAVEIITLKSKEGLEILRHSSAHVLAEAVIDIFSDAKPTIGPAIEDGFYYDFDVKKQFSPEALEKIEAKMKEIIKKDEPFLRIVMSKKDALAHFKKEGNVYKQELISELKEGEEISFYKNGSFIDLCRGPHMPSTGFLKAVKLMKVSGAYWRGNAKNKMLSRIYGISFLNKKELSSYITMLEEAEKRDHRKLGTQLELYSFHDEGSGFPFFHPKGMVIWNVLEGFWREEHKKAGYVEISTPIILKKDLWLQSGHWDHYKDNMYFTQIDGNDYAIKPMNCPGGMIVYKSKKHSYKEFPMRVAELGMVHRHELSGVLHGLMRVRRFTQDDAHVFMTEGQIKDEIKNVMALIDKIYKVFGFEYHVELSTKPEKAMGSDEIWDKATESLKNALEESKMKYVVNEGDGAFYGPKIDFHIKDCIGRTWQCATIQLDFLMPERFDLKYTGEDNKLHRPVMIHRVIFGSFERFIGILVEHFAGAFPTWLAPVQVKLITIADRHIEYAEKVKHKLLDAGVRVEADFRTETVEYKIRDAQLQKIPYMLVVGDKEINKNAVTVRTRAGKVTYGVDVGKFLEDITDEIKSRKI
ncbi:threonine--tRNA ligase [archaeon]|nr:threonine--tRNA ligase [archaeon]